MDEAASKVHIGRLCEQPEAAGQRERRTMQQRNAGSAGRSDSAGGNMADVQRRLQEDLKASEIKHDL